MTIKAGMARLFIAQKGLCFHCDKPMLMHPARKKKSGSYNEGWTREHVFPKSRGGKNAGNIVLAHLTCNSKRRAAPLSYEALLKAAQIYEKASRISRKAAGHVMCDPGLRQAALA